MLGRIIEIFISSNLQRRPRIFREFLMLGRIIEIFISSNLQRKPRTFMNFFMLGRMMKIRSIYFFNSAKKTQYI